MSFDNRNDLGLTDKSTAASGGGCCGGGGCMCGHGAPATSSATVSAEAPSSPSTSPSTSSGEPSGTDFLVTGMTCGHCVSSVTEELSALDGVQSVSVQLDAAGASRVTVAADRVLDVDAVRAAIDEAGYALVDQA